MTAVNGIRVRELICQMLAAPAGVRSMAADRVTDWIQSFDKSEAAVLSRVLLWLALEESDDKAREAQIHALAKLAERELVPADVLRDASKLRVNRSGTGVQGGVGVAHAFAEFDGGGGLDPHHRDLGAGRPGTGRANRRPLPAG